METFREIVADISPEEKKTCADSVSSGVEALSGSKENKVKDVKWRTKLIIIVFAALFIMVSLVFIFSNINRAHKCGDNSSWKYNFYTDTLTISGSGSIYDNYWKYKETSFPVKKIIIKDGVTSIGKSTFAKCISLESIEIPESVVSIGASAFDGCTSLSEIRIPDGVTSIRNNVFSGCSSLSSVMLPDGITSIEKSAFAECVSLESVEIPGSVVTIGACAFDRCTRLSELMISDGTKFIGDRVFRNCSCLSSIVLPNSIISIGRWTFKNCSALEHISIPANVKTIGAGAFCGCQTLSGIAVPDSIEYIGPWAFEDCDSIIDIKIPDGITMIGDGLFYNCDGLVSITIPESVTEIGKEAFCNCRNLKDIKLPEGLISIGERTFYNCSVISGITIPEDIVSIGEGAFESGCIPQFDKPPVIISSDLKDKCGVYSLEEQKELVINNIGYFDELAKTLLENESGLDVHYTIDRSEITWIYDWMHSGFRININADKEEYIDEKTIELIEQFFIDYQCRSISCSRNYQSKQRYVNIQFWNDLSGNQGIQYFPESFNNNEPASHCYQQIIGNWYLYVFPTMCV